ncbi:efflux RND transporter periplasmic adaptor subunit [Cytobacillus sp. S13-E01]|uniref:HlyD family secretion protein n=1 Tax=Cytobacillus sp. S13-E01 TaxID=3031326 RepID=UPI0023D85690|nr:efflux RND transporter periplasmic adaptor subunit [Cytobacillus sp. S13-E01]MDF0728523.1 efflux RND transporter periplasmic adaptor subunit [Cytobacillus sp. S13-E01]
MFVKKLKYLPTTSFILSVILLASCGIGEVSQNNIQKKIFTEVKVSAAQENQEITLKGVTEPFEEVVVSPSVTGGIKELFVELGSYVEKGQELAVLDDSDLNYQIEQAKTLLNLKKAEAEVNAMGQEISLNETMVMITANLSPNIEQGKIAVNEAEVELGNLKKAFKKRESELKEDSIKQKELEQLNVQIAEAKLRLERAKQALETEKAQDSKQEEVEQATAKLFELENLKKAWEKKENELKQGLIETQELEQLKVQIAKAEQRLGRAKQMLEEEKAQDSKRKEVARATTNLQKKSNSIADERTSFEIKKSESEIQLMQRQLENLIINAPINGYITELNAIAGGSVTPNDLMFAIKNIDELYIDTDVPEAFINKIKKDQTVTVNFPTLGKTVQGKITYISIIGNASTQTFPIKVLIENKDHVIKGGMVAQVKIMSQ